MNRLVVVASLASLSLLSACSNPAEGSEPKEPAESPVLRDISGVVLSSVGVLTPGATVVLDGDRQVITGADGRFDFSDVGERYRLSVAFGREIIVLDGLRRVDPTVSLQGRGRQAQLSGSIEGVEFPLPDGQAIAFFSGGAGSVWKGGGDARFIKAASFENLGLEWTGSQAPEAIVAALVEPSYAFTVLKASEPLPVDLSRKSSLDGLHFTLDQEVTRAETLISREPGAYTLDRGVFLEALELQGGRALVSWKLSIPEGDPFSFPAEGGATLRYVGADRAGVSCETTAPAIADGTTTLRCPEIPAFVPLSPLEDAIDVSTTPTIRWNPDPDSKAYWIQIGGEEGHFTWIVPAPADSLEIGPDLPEGQLRPGSTYTFWIRTFLNDGFDADALTDGSGFWSERLNLATGPTTMLHAPYHFTTAP